MDAAAKKTALRMIPYGLYILTAENEAGQVAAATVNWVTQTAFEPPLLVVAVKKNSATYRILSESRVFALNILGKGQQEMAFTFFKPLERDGQSIGGQPFYAGQTGTPIFESTPAFVECKLVETVEKGDHAIVIGEVVNAGVASALGGRPDDAILWLKDLGDNVFYGG